MGENLQKASRTATARRDGARATWFAPVFLAVAAGISMVCLARNVRVPGDGLVAPTRYGEVPGLIVTRLDRLPVGGEVREHLRLWDPARLFLPRPPAADPANAAEGIVDRPGGNVTEPFPAALAFKDMDPAQEILRPAPPRTPLAAMDAAGEARWFAGMARGDDRADGGAPPASGGKSKMDVYPVGAAERLAFIGLPDDAALQASLWRPIELSVLIGAAGTVSPPVIIAGSGAGEVDARVRWLVSHELLPRLRLRPGAYRLVVGP